MIQPFCRRGPGNFIGSMWILVGNAIIFMNSEILFSLALGLQSPWQVKDVTFSTDESARTCFICISLYFRLTLPRWGECGLSGAWYRRTAVATFELFWAYLLPPLCGASHNHYWWKSSNGRRSLGTPGQRFYLIIRSLGVSLDRAGNAG